MNAKAELIVHDTTDAATPRRPSTTLDMLNQAVALGNIDMVERLMALHERHEANQARRSFDEAIAAAKAEIPVITKNRTVDFTSNKGRTHYRYEDLAGVASVVNPILAKYGLSYRYRTTSLPNEPVTVTCIISHRDGHSEENTLTAGRDDSGNKNPIQQVNSTITYLQRITLKAALGLAAGDDDDGRAAGGAEEDPPITDEQIGVLRKLIMDTDSDIPKFLTAIKVDRLEDLTASGFKAAERKLLAKQARAASEAPNG